MEHTKIVTATQLESYAETRESEAVIPELIYLLITGSAADITQCRIPYGDKVNEQGWDGMVNSANGFRQFVPPSASYWEVGTGNDPGKKATSDFRKRTDAMPQGERNATTYVFVTPRSGGARGWPEPAQTKWKQQRTDKGWRDIRILDGHQLADWLREFPAIGKWLAKKIGVIANMSGVATPAEHWENIRQLRLLDDPVLPNSTFLIGREKACAELRRLFVGETQELLLAAEGEDDAEDFVSAFLDSLDENARQLFNNRCLFIQDQEAWLSFANLKIPHVLVASPRLNLEQNAQLHLTAKKHGHGVVIPISSRWAHGGGALIPLRSPSKSKLETVLRENGFERNRAKEIASAGALNLAALKRHLRGLGELPPYANWENARILSQAGLLGKWDGGNAADRDAIGELLGKSYGEWIEAARGESLRAGTPLIQRDEKWKVISRGEAWAALGPRLTNNDLDQFKKVALLVLGEHDPKFDLPPDEHYMARINGKSLSHSDAMREGLAETLALLGSRPNHLTSCTRGTPEGAAASVVRTLLDDATWIRWASLNSYLPLLAEAAPNEFMSAIEDALVTPAESPFCKVFAQESSGGIGGQNYMVGLLWALETLAWHPDYLARVSAILGELASIDPGGSWSNRPANSLKDILLPWHPQTIAPLSLRLVAVKNLLRELPQVGWNVLLGLLPQMHGMTSGSSKPTWRAFVPDDWTEGVTQGEYWEQISGYAELATEAASKDVEKLAELIDRLPDLPMPAHKKVLDHLESALVLSLDEETRQPLWESLIDLAAKHRKFSDAQWAMSINVVAKIEKVADKLAPKSLLLLYRRLFSERDFDLYEEKGSYEDQSNQLEIRRQEAIEAILHEHSLSGVLEFVQQVDSPRKVGFVLGALEYESSDSILLPQYLVAPDKKLLQFVSSFVWERFKNKGWSWADPMLHSNWDTQQKTGFLTMLPFAQEAWLRVDEVLQSDREKYWKSVMSDPWRLSEVELVEAARQLLLFGRPFPAIDCFALLARKGHQFPTKLAAEALLSAIAKPTEFVGSAQHHIRQVIKCLQENLPADSEELLTVEWAYLTLLDRNYEDVAPRALVHRLTSSPEFFLQIISAAFRSEKAEPSEQVITDSQRAIARNAYRLLDAWRTIPGFVKEHAFDGAAFDDWLVEVKTLSTESGHRPIAMSKIGEALVHAPSDLAGLWIHKSVAEALNAKDGKELRSGFATALFNSRGVFSPSAGVQERNLAQGFRVKADALERQGFQRIAATLRDVADDYDRRAEKDADSSTFDG